MSQTDTARPLQRSDVERSADSVQRSQRTIETTEMLSLLSDEYARRVLRALVEEPLSAREVVDRLEMSRATVYRRLNRLESAGVLESSMRIDPEGHHRRQFHVVVDRMRLSVESGGVTLETDG